ncbi:transcription elongation factor GreA [Cryobacterium sp. TMT1-21]|uniref:Transcription elongation factor GreA n=1 Tax=Cryobacterium shii TaxID=1259235 RepID=A0AAQ2C7X2_9MICO|nr:MULTISPECIES: transcription elongation factor GreA [Cryobacterium]TFC51197.1 transcription elongation factor GreA [Cryobacterium shii]TFC80500.1 transcription elongation factor GreA [Cryobacterium sp. TmT2-59]TFD17012.1 transcription elongation factor GreA [Cryobacterium sp. TMT1-21]TFD17487.1 transcription elongation factor GreA [Cryobacterium sp. TMT4-10]TFD18230.1 transcription elongation factor GreA [Cryobacterium sp. TMT2-23]
MTTETTVTWLTQEAYDRLAAELETMSTVGRVEIAKKIESAREEGDLKENSGYHAAKDEQGKMEARIRTLVLLLRNAEVGHAPESKGVVEPGTVITATIAGEENRFLIGSREIAGDSDLDVFSEQSPLGAAILGLKVGAKTSYITPTGKDIAVEIFLVETWTGN